MDSLIFVASNCFAFGFGWVMGKFFDDWPELNEPGQLNSNEDLVNLDSSPSSSTPLSQSRSCMARRQRCRRRRQRMSNFARKGRLIETFNKHKHRQLLSTFNKKELVELLEVLKKNTDSLENVSATLTNLNETLKNKGLDSIPQSFVHLQSPVKVDKVRPYESKPGDESSLKDSGFTEGPILPSKSYRPEFGNYCQDKSATMHIYDDNFEVPKRDASWALKTSGDKNLDRHAKECTPKLSKEKNPSSIDELRGMFQECHKGNLPGSNGTDMITKPGGGYASIGELNKKNKGQEVALDVFKTQSKKKSRDVPEGQRRKQILSRGDELDIINSFSSMKGLGWKEAVILAQEQGYHLHATYINGRSNYASEYSKTVVGVKVKDLTFDYLLGSDHRGFGSEAVITAIIDIGGQDMYKRGL